MRELLLVGVGVLGGVGLGFVLFHASAEPCPVGDATEVDVTASRSGGEVAERRGRAPVRPQPRDVARHGAAERSAAAAELDAVRARLRELETRVAAEDEERVARQGEARPMPGDLEPRFQQEAVRTSVNAAIKELGLDGEVTVADCSEYPCLLVGELRDRPFGREESEKLGASAAMAGYGEDSHSGFGSSRGEGEGARHIFGFAVFPKAASDEEREAISKRLRFRFGEMQHEGE